MSTPFPDRLRDAREARGFSQSDLAKRASLQSAAISHFETGRRAPSFDNLQKLATALSVSVDFLLGRIDEKKHGQGLAADPRAQRLFRNAEKLSDEGFSQLELMAQMLRQREEQKKSDAQ